MKRIRSRRWFTGVGLMVEEINMISGRVTCKLYRNGSPTKFWESA